MLHCRVTPSSVCRLSVFLVGISTGPTISPLCALSQAVPDFHLAAECENRWQSLGSANRKRGRGARPFVAQAEQLCQDKFRVFAFRLRQHFLLLSGSSNQQQDIQYWSRLQPDVLRPDSFFNRMSLRCCIAASRPLSAHACSLRAIKSGA